MITSNYVLNILESIVDPSEREVILYILKYLPLWLQGSKNFPQQVLGFFKRSIPQSMYSGKCYRVIYLHTDYLIKKRIISSVDELLNSYLKVKSILTNKDFLNYNCSWSKSVQGVYNAERYLSAGRGKNLIRVLISDQITGIDVKKVMDYFDSLYFVSDNDTMTTQYGKNDVYRKDKEVQKAFKKAFSNQLTNHYAMTQEEVIAPLNPSTFQIVSVERI